MITTKNLTLSYKDVPSSWVFKYYCNIEENLDGQDIKIRSVFGNQDRDPSMCIFLNKTTDSYNFKDFSTGNGGSAVELVKLLFKISTKEATAKIRDDYNKFITENGKFEENLKEYKKYKVSRWEIRKWNLYDREYWTQFNINSNILERFNVKPLSWYEMSKEGHVIRIERSYIYGYFKKDGTLYKVYQPKNEKKKFIKVDVYLQGSEQLRNNKCLLITSSLKDIMSLESLKLEVDLVAPDSENTLIKREVLEEFKKDYDYIGVLLDNDEAGIKAMKKYREDYGLEPILLQLSKDPADSNRDYGPEKVKYTLVPLIQSLKPIHKPVKNTTTINETLDFQWEENQVS